MIAKLKGQVDSLIDSGVIIDVQGVGYAVSCSQKTLATLPQVGEAISLYIETIVREDLIQLYGFADTIEKDWFKLLTTVQGVGNRVALAILSTLSPAEIEQALVMQDKAAISRADGVGPKLATRLLNELKDKRPAHAVGTAFHMAAPAPTMGASSEAVSALVNLGYRRHEAAEAVARACKDASAQSVEDMIKAGLSQLVRS